jgi:UMF1 family MFS transporter
VAVWWGGFTLFTLAWVPEPGIGQGRPGGFRALADGVRELRGTFARLRSYRPAFIFLAAYWCYIDGVDTIIRMAVDYGLSLGFPASDLITALLIVQFVGFPAAIAFGRMGQRLGPRRSIYIGIAVYMGVTVWGTVMSDRMEFYVMAVVIGLVQGGVQALSRSYYARLIPPDKPAEFFGFYNMLGKFASVVGPALMGGVGLLVRGVLMPDAPTPEQLIRVGQTAARWGIASILVLFVAGAVLLYFVKEPPRPESGAAAPPRGC